MDQEAVSLTDFAAVAPVPSAAVDAPPADDVSVVAWQLQELEPPDMSTRQLLAMVVSTMANHCVAGVDEIQDTVQRMIRRATSAQRRTVNLDIDFGCELMREASGQVLWIFHLHLEIYHAGLRKCVMVGLPAYLFRRLQSVTNAAARLIYGLRHSDHISDVLISLHWLRAQERVRFKMAVLMLASSEKTIWTKEATIKLLELVKRNYGAFTDKMTKKQIHVARNCSAST